MKILVCHDGSKKAQKSLEKTLSLFGSLKPEIILLTIIEESRDISGESENAFQLEFSKRKKEILKTAKDIIKKGMDVDALFYTGERRKTILTVAAAKNPDFIVLGRRKGNSSQKFQISTTEYIFHHSTHPVLIF